MHTYNRTNHIQSRLLQVEETTESETFDLRGTKQPGLWLADASSSRLRAAFTCWISCLPSVRRRMSSSTSHCGSLEQEAGCCCWEQSSCVSPAWCFSSLGPGTLSWVLFVLKGSTGILNCEVQSQLLGSWSLDWLVELIITFLNCSIFLIFDFLQEWWCQ